MKRQATALEEAVRMAWIGWGDYSQFTVCSGCNQFTACRSRRRGRWLCLECFDQEEG